MTHRAVMTPGLVRWMFTIPEVKANFRAVTVVAYMVILVIVGGVDTIE